MCIIFAGFFFFFCFPSLLLDASSASFSLVSLLFLFYPWFLFSSIVGVRSEWSLIAWRFLFSSFFSPLRAAGLHWVLVSGLLPLFSFSSLFVSLRERCLLVLEGYPWAGVRGYLGVLIKLVLGFARCCLE